VRKEVIQSKIGLKESRNNMSSTSHGRRNNIINVQKLKRRIQKKSPS
jgi:hypothetical protein